MRVILSLALAFTIGWFGSLLISEDIHKSVQMPANHSLLSPRAQVSSAPSWTKTATNRDLSVAERLLAISRANISSNADSIATLQRLREEPANLFRSESLSILFEAWLQSDPDEALEHCLNLKHQSFKESALKTLAGKWGEIDIGSAIRNMRNLPKTLSIRSELLKSLGVALALTAPGKAAAMLASEDMREGSEIQQIYEALAEQGLEKALVQADESKSHDAMQAVLTVWMKQDFDGSIAQLKYRPQLGTNRMREIVKANLSNIIANDPVRAVERLTSQLDPDIWRDLRTPFTEAWMENDRDAAINWATNLTDQKERFETAKLLAGLLGNDDTQAKIDLGVSHRSGMSQAWVDQNWDEGLATMRDLTDQPQAQAVTAVHLLRSRKELISIPNLRELLSIIEGQYGAGYIPSFEQLSPPEVIALIQDYPKSIAHSMEVYLGTLVTKDPQAAITVANALPKEALGRTKVMVQTWAEDDPAAAGAWLTALPEGHGKVEAYQSYANALTRAAPMQARAWLETLPNELREPSAREFVKITAPSNPQEALAVAQSIQDADLISDAMAYWHHRDPAAARQAATEFDSDLLTTIQERFDLNDQWRALGEPVDSP